MADETTGRQLSALATGAAAEGATPAGTMSPTPGDAGPEGGAAPQDPQGIPGAEEILGPQEGQVQTEQVQPQPQAPPEESPRPQRRLTTRLGWLLIDNGLISEDDLNAALEDQVDSGERLGHYLVEKGLVQEADLVRLLSDQYGVPAADIEELEVLDKVLELVPAELTYGLERLAAFVHMELARALDHRCGARVL